MINTSNEYKRYISDSVDSTLSRDFTARADIELADSTILNITEEDIVVKGLKISDATSSNNSFQIGSAIINQCTLLLNNIGGKFDRYDFTDAIIRPYIGLKLSQTTEWLNKGVFTVDEPTVANSIISLIALDNMYKFDTPFSEVAINFPCTSLQLLQAVCLHCGVSLATLQYLNNNFTIVRRPSDEATTCREIIAWIGQISGNFARCNNVGALELKWYDITAFEQSDNLDGGAFDDNSPYSTGDNADGGNFTDYNTGDNVDGGNFLQMNKYHHIYALDQARINTDDIIITGIQVKAMGTQEDYGETVLFGSDGYVIEIKDNYLIQENTAAAIAHSIGAKIVGMRFRPCNISALSDPSREAGDVAYLSHKNNTYQILITNMSYQIGKNNSISCCAETPSRKQSVRFDASTKAIIEARKQAKQQLTAYDLAVQQLNSVMANAMGYYPVREENEDGSYIDYMCDKPTLAESQIIWKKSIDGFAVSTNGGTTWTSGFTADGNIIAQTLSVIGINAEWIKVLTSFTVGTQFSVNALGKLIASNADISGKITADSGKIGPFTIDQYGLQSRLFEFMERDNYPLLWLTKPAKNGSLSPADGWERANYEPAVTVLRNIEGDVSTEISIMARHRPDTNETGTFEIKKSDGVDSSNVMLSDKGLRVRKDIDGEDSSIDLTSFGLFTYDYNTSSGFTIIHSNGDLYIQNSSNSSIMMTVAGMYITSESNTPVYLNGVDVVAEINSLRTRVNATELDIFAIKQRLNMT